MVKKILKKILKKEEPPASVEVDNIVKSYPKVSIEGDGTETQDERIKE